MSKPAKYTYDTLNAKINEYLNKFGDIEVNLKLAQMPTIEGLNLHLGVSKMTISNWMNGKKCRNNDTSTYDNEDENIDDISFKRLIEDARDNIKIILQRMMIYHENKIGKTLTSVLAYLNSPAFDYTGKMDGNINKSSEMTLTIKMDSEMELDAK